MPKTTPLKLDKFNIHKLLIDHLNLLQIEPELQEVQAAPIFTVPVFEHVEKGLSDSSKSRFPQYGLLGGLSEILNKKTTVSNNSQDPRIFFNIASPSSTFVCGSQGSGKSHTLSCLLENCLFSSKASKLVNPLTGLVLHYDTFISDAGGSPCEAAFLSSNPDIKVRVLCSPANIHTIKRAYSGLNVQIEPLRINESDLNTKRMLDLMAVNQDDGPMPLYLHVVNRILRDMRIEQQKAETTFDYQSFKLQLMGAGMTPAQMGPLNQRLDTLESFMPKAQTGAEQSYMRKGGFQGKGKEKVQGKVQGKVQEKVQGKVQGNVQGKVQGKAAGKGGNDWTPKPGRLTIVDLSCPCITSEGACSLFNICLSIFLEQSIDVGRVIALDEAHKYMNTSAEASTLRNTLLSTVRLQRHLGARVIISTQEPTISPSLLDLSSVVIVHRFTSPEWLNSLKRHLAGAASDLLDGDNTDSNGLASSKGKGDGTKRLFAEIVKLRVGEALLFSPNAMIDVEVDSNGKVTLKKLGDGFLKIRVRMRLTADGGKSIMAT
ncbi:hypothetical protein OCU04_008634 [Sclerotinia nivalis]|uniref:P-loop containing nucleoside triphosphate hydrolase protein n=1 Tax=Sclerotinia nivalis TaxID=352851 RepID=A0A9X0AJC8_9HELO|nr:hypothetical protein OCU04_008634 [Sclerotinia nivalis]